MYESGRCWMPLVPAPTGLPGPAAVSSASSSQPGWSPWLLRHQTPRVPKPARYHELDRLPCPLRRSADTYAPESGQAPITERVRSRAQRRVRSPIYGRTDGVCASTTVLSVSANSARWWFVDLGQGFPEVVVDGSAAAMVWGPPGGGRSRPSSPSAVLVACSACRATRSHQKIRPTMWTPEYQARSPASR
jgi:hypothetical protein